MGVVEGSVVEFEGGDVYFVGCGVECDTGVGVVWLLGGVSKLNVRGIGYWSGDSGVFWVSGLTRVFFWGFVVISGKSGSWSLEISVGISYGKVIARLFE